MFQNGISRVAITKPADLNAYLRIFIGKSKKNMFTA